MITQDFECWECSGNFSDRDSILDWKVAGGCLGAHYSGTCPLCKKQSLFRNTTNPVVEDTVLEILKERNVTGIHNFSIKQKG